MEREDYFKQTSELTAMYKTVISEIENLVSAEEIVEIDKVLLNFFEVYFNYTGIRNLRENLLEWLTKLLLKLKRLPMVNLLLAYFEFKESLMNEIDDSAQVTFALISEVENGVLAISIVSQDESVKQNIKQILVNRDDNDFFVYKYDKDVLNISLKDSVLKLKPKSLKYNRITKSNLICLETYIRDHIQLTKRATSKFKSTFELVKRYLTVNLNSEYECEILPFGSVTQFSQNVASDLEITILTNHDEKIVMEEVLSLLKQNTNFEKFRIRPTKRANLIIFDCKINDVTIELMLNNYLGVINSELIRNYCLMDVRVGLLINIIKDWSKIHKINGNFHKYLSSYCFSLMVIYFLQKGEKILPVLQKNKTFDNLRLNDLDGKQLHFLVERTKPDGNVKIDNLTLAELVYKFFYFYLFCFNELDYCIDISSEAVIFRNNDIKYLNYFYEQSAYCIIDPYDYTYNPGGYMKRKGDNFKTFKEEMEIVLEKITNKHECRNIFKRKVDH
jgi:DNA polymerase sigma